MSDAQLLQASSMNLDIVRQQRDAGRTDPRSKPTAITEYTIVWVHRNILEVDGEDYVFYTLGTVGMLDQPRRLSEVYYHGRRPYVIGFCAIETHRTYPSGPVRMGSEIQRELNENANQRSDNVKFALNKKWLVKRTAQVDLRSLQRNAPGSVTMVNDPGDGKDVRVIDTPDVTRSAYEEQDRLNLDFDDLVGNFSQSSVQANRKLNETVGGLNIINSNSNQITAYQLTCFVETWMEPVLEQLDALEQEYETDEEVLALAAKQAKLLEQYGINAVTDDLMMQEVIIDVNVGLAAVNPHDQVQNFIEALRALREILADGSLIAYGLDIGEAIKEIFGKLGYRDGRRFFPDDQDSRIKGLLATIEQLQAALKAKQPPEVIAAQVAKLRAEADEITARKVKTGVDSSFAAVQTAEVIATVPRVAPVADAVLQAAGYRPPQPPGVDPNLPDPGLQAPTTGPAMQQPESGVPRNTSPTMPPRPQAPASPEVGARQGIETQRADSEGP